MENKPCSGCLDADAEAIQKPSVGARTSVREFAYSIPATVFTALQSQTITIPTYSDSYFVVTKLAAVSTGAFTSRFYNGSTGRTLSDVLVNNVNVFGTAQLPNRLRTPIILPPSSNFQLQIVDSSNSGNTIQCTLLGYRWYDLSKYPTMNKSGARMEWFQFSAAVVLAGNGQNNIITRIDADADFLVQKIVGNRTGAYNLQLSDSAAADTWQDQPVRDANYVGTAQYPYILSKPRLVTRNSTISAQVLDVSGSSNTIQLIYEGAKIYR